METKTMLSLDVLTLGAPDVEAARECYTEALAPVVAADHALWVELDMHDTGRVGLSDTAGLVAEAASASGPYGFLGYIVAYVLAQPTEDSAAVYDSGRDGATCLTS